MQCVMCGYDSPRDSETGYEEPYCSKACRDEDAAHDDAWVTEEEADRHEAWMRANGWYLDEEIAERWFPEEKEVA